MENLKIQDFKEMSKWSFKRKVKGYISQLHREELLEEIRGYKKLKFEELSADNFERKPYNRQFELGKLSHEVSCGRQPRSYNIR